MIDGWTNDDARFLRKFLYESDTGKKLVDVFKQMEPDLDAANFEASALQAAALKQYKIDKKFIQNAMELQPETQPEDQGIPVEKLDVVE